MAERQSGKHVQLALNATSPTSTSEAASTWRVHHEHADPRHASDKPLKYHMYNSRVPSHHLVREVHMANGIPSRLSNRIDAMFALINTHHTSSLLNSLINNTSKYRIYKSRVSSHRPLRVFNITSQVSSQLSTRLEAVLTLINQHRSSYLPNS